MDQQKRRIVKIRPATLIAMLALFIAVGGTATAASGLINGKQIKKGTVTNKAFKDQTITKAKISLSSLSGLAGAQGPRGEKGAKGDPGSNGPNGDQGPAGRPGTTTIVGKATKVAQVPNQDVNQVVLNGLPGSRYVLTASVNVISQTGGSQVDCEIEAGNGASDTAQWTNPASSSRGTLFMVLPTGTEVTSAKVVCNSGTSSATLRTTLTAIPAL